jgi:hypothetical protein
MDEFYMKKILRNLYLISIITLASCSVGLAKPQNIDLDCWDTTYPDDGDTGSGGEEPTTPPEPTPDPDPEPDPEPDPPPRPSIPLPSLINPQPNYVISLTGRNTIYLLEASIVGVTYVGTARLPAGWTIQAKSSSPLVTVSSEPDAVRIIYIGPPNTVGTLTFELVFANIVYDTVTIPFR